MIILRIIPNTTPKVLSTTDKKLSWTRSRIFWFINPTITKITKNTMKYETTKLLDLKEPPTCILYPDDFAALGGINAIRQRNLRIPEDISIAGYDGLELAKRLSPRLTTVTQNSEKIGDIAASKLIDLINNPKGTLVEQIVVEGILEPGESVRKIQ